MNEDVKPEATTTEERMYEALVWMSGSDHFSPGGKAHEGFEKIVRPVLDEWVTQK